MVGCGEGYVGDDGGRGGEGRFGTCVEGAGREGVRGVREGSGHAEDAVVGLGEGGGGRRERDAVRSESTFRRVDVATLRRSALWSDSIGGTATTTTSKLHTTYTNDDSKQVSEPSFSHVLLDISHLTSIPPRARLGDQRGDLYHIFEDTISGIKSRRGRGKGEEGSTMLF